MRAELAAAMAARVLEADSDVHAEVSRPKLRRALELDLGEDGEITAEEIDRIVTGDGTWRGCVPDDLAARFPNLDRALEEFF